MTSGIFALAVRFMRVRRLRTALAGVSVALGVGLLAALLTLNTTMEVSVEAYLTRVYGNYDVMAGYRKPDLRLSEAGVEVIRQQPGVMDAAGILIPYMQESHPELVPLRLNYFGAPDSPLGRQFMPISQGSFPGPGEVAVSEAWAKKAGLQVGSALELTFPPGGTRQVRISGLLPTPGQLSVGIGLFERSWLEAATARPGSTFTLIRIARGTDVQGLSNTLRTLFPELEVDPRKFMDEARKNLNALRPVGLGMGVAALLAAAFLLTGAFRISLAERVRELALLRAVGALPAQVRRLILAEGILVGAAGSAVGALAGAGAAAALAGASARLMGTEAVPPVIPWAWLGLAAAGGTVISLLAALSVALAAGRTEPLRAMRPDLPAEALQSLRGGLFGMILLVLGGLALAVRPFLPGSDGIDFLLPLVGSTGGLAVALGLLLGLQRLLPVLLQVLTFPLRRTAPAPLAVRSLLRHRRRSGHTVGAMGLGLILVVAVSTLGSSLLGRWHRQVRDEHPADIQVEVPRVFGQGVSTSLVDEVTHVPGVTSVAAVGEGVQTVVTGWDWSRADPRWMAEMERWKNRYWKGHEALSVQWADLPALVEMGAYKVLEGSLGNWGESSIALTKDRAKLLGAKPGDQLRLNVSQAPLSERAANPQIRTYTVAAILNDASYKLPWVVVGAPVPGSTGKVMAIYATTEPARRDEARTQVKGLLQRLEYSIADYSDYESATQQLRAQMAQRFTLLLAVAAIMAAVAAMSLVNTMVSSATERRREFALVRAVGATPDQVQTQVMLEAGLLGLIGGITGVAGGAVLGTAALTALEMPLSDVRLPWAVMGVGLLMSVAIACLAALGPAHRTAGLAPAEAVRAE